MLDEGTTDDELVDDDVEVVLTVVVDVDDLLDDEHAASNTTVATNSTDMTLPRLIAYLPVRLRQARVRPSLPYRSAAHRGVSPWDS
ncbi:MAG: hypothetical protein JWM72_720 [Actinomycetia bacterium]|nr:hypothetical protein [Actinomycetes bacterium]